MVTMISAPYVLFLIKNIIASFDIESALSYHEYLNGRHPLFLYCSYNNILVRIGLFNITRPYCLAANNR